jgi:hypothetical protein
MLKVELLSREREATRSLRSLAVDRADCSIAYPPGALNARGVGIHSEKLRWLMGRFPADYAACAPPPRPSPTLQTARRALGKGAR